MRKQLWRRWTVDKPAAFGDLMWDVLVVQFAAWLDRLTLRQIIAFVPVIILVLAYYHSIPLPPELMLVGDVLAYIDIFSVILLLSILGRVATFLFFAKRTAEHAVKLASRGLLSIRRFAFQRQREGSMRGRKRLTDRANSDDGRPATAGFAWA
jgi:hypothetical protein